MSGPRSIQVLGIDIACGILLAAVIGGFIWLAFLRDNSAQDELGKLNSRVKTTRNDIAALRAVLDEERKLFAARQAELKETGQLPSRIPVEQDLQTLSVLAKEHELSVVKVEPLPSREYPGLLETRYTFEALGNMPDITRFFKAIEEAEFWADVSYFQVRGRARSTGWSSSEELVVTLTISMFSSAS